MRPSAERLSPTMPDFAPYSQDWRGLREKYSPDPRPLIPGQDSLAATQRAAHDAASHLRMEDTNTLKSKMPLLNRYVQSLCGLYSRIARQLNVDRSYVSRVARGERHSEEIERALNNEFTRITEEQAPQENA
jgi:hypothetical protein